METNKNIDWEQRRYEIAKEVMASSFSTINNRGSIQSYVACCVETAELLVEELQKPKKQDKFSRIVEQAPEMYKVLQRITDINANDLMTDYAALNLAKNLAYEVLNKCKADYPEIEE